MQVIYQLYFCEDFLELPPQYFQLAHGSNYYRKTQKFFYHLPLRAPVPKFEDHLGKFHRSLLLQHMASARHR